MSGRDLVRGLRTEAAPAPKQRGGGALDLLIGAVAVIAVASFGYFGYATLMAPEVAVSATASVPTSPSAPGPSNSTIINADYSWTDADASRCHAEAQAAVEAPLPVDVILSQRSVTDGFTGLATLVACQISSKIKRFCEPAGKEKLVTLVHHYLDRIDLVILGMGIQGAPMTVLGEAFGGEIAAGSTIYDLEKEGTFAVMRVHHRKVVDSIKMLAREGVVTAGDFGTFMGMGVPPPIKEMLAGVEAERNVCTSKA